MQQLSSSRRGRTAAATSNTRARVRRSVAVAAVKRAKQYVARKELQNAAKHEYLKNVYEAADRIEADHLVFELKPSSPRLRAQQQQHAATAGLNRQLAQQIPQLCDWQQLQAFLQQHSSVLNFMAVTAVASQAAVIHKALGPPPQQDCPTLLLDLSAQLLQASSWFEPAHFAAAAAAMCSCGVTDVEFWDNLVAAAEHKVGAFSFAQLAQVLTALATVGFVPDLQWIERCYRQASKHLHAAEPEDVCALLWAWGEMGYVPRDRLFLNQVKVISRRAFDAQQLSGLQLVQLLHGLARMPKYAPNPGWLLALCRRVQPLLQEVSPGDTLDLLLSLASLGHKPPDIWMRAALARIQDGFSSSSNSSSSAQHVVLLLPPVELQQQFWSSISPAGITEAGLLASAGAAGGKMAAAAAVYGGASGRQELPSAEELEQLQDMFAAVAAEGDAAAEAGEDASSPPAAEAANAGSGLDQQQQQHAVGSEIAGTSQQQQQQQQEEELGAEHFGVLCWCLGRLEHQPPPQWVQQLGQQLLHHCTAASGEVLVDALLGCVILGYLPVGQLQQQLLARAAEVAPSMQPETLRRLCQALVMLEQGLEAYAAADDAQDAAAAAAAAVGVEQRRQQQQPPARRGRSRQRRSRTASTSTTSSTGASACILAAASLQKYQQQQLPQLAQAIAHRQGIILWQSSTQQLADVFAFIAASGLQPSQEYMATGVSKAVDRLADGAPTVSVATLLWSLARLGFKPHPQLLHQLLAALQRGLHLLSSQDLADVGWALCTLKHRPGSAWLGVYMHQVASKAAYMSEQALTDTLWALACFAAQPDREWLKLVLLAAGKLEVSNRNAAVMLWAMQQLGFQPQAEGWGLQQGAAGGEVQRAVEALLQNVLQAGDAVVEQQQQGTRVALAA